MLTSVGSLTCVRHRLTAAFHLPRGLVDGHQRSGSLLPWTHEQRSLDDDLVAVVVLLGDQRGLDALVEVLRALGDALEDLARVGGGVLVLVLGDCGLVQ